MTSRIAIDQRLLFRERFIVALRTAGIPVRASTVAREFNLRADGATVTTHAVRKWLAGESFPTHERMEILSGWLGVNALWLLYGGAENTVSLPAQPQPALAAEDFMLARDFSRLSPSGKRILREILDILMKTMP